jgi:hypothetical protein
VLWTLPVRVLWTLQVRVLWTLQVRVLWTLQVLEQAFWGARRHLAAVCIFRRSPNSVPVRRSSRFSATSVCRLPFFDLAVRP